MKYSCEIIKDLLPLYIDNVCSSESKSVVDEHLFECSECRKFFDSIKEDNTLVETKVDNEGDLRLEKGLKNIKKRLNKKRKAIIFSFIAAVIVLFFSFQLLFSMPLKSLDTNDVSVSASVYRLEDLKSETRNEGSVTITLGEDDKTVIKVLSIPELGEVSMSQETIDKNKYATVISWKSPYFLRAIEYEKEKNEKDDKTLYISGFKTTFLNNKSENYNQSIVNFELKEIEKIVYVEKNGVEKVLWENK